MAVPGNSPERMRFCPRLVNSLFFRLVVRDRSHLAFQDAAFFTTTRPKSLFFVEALRFVLRRSILSSIARVRILFDSKHAVKGRAGFSACNEERYCCKPRTRSNHPMCSQAANVGSECAGLAASLGNFGLTSNSTTASDGLEVSSPQRVRSMGLILVKKSNLGCST